MWNLSSLQWQHSFEYIIYDILYMIWTGPFNGVQRFEKQFERLSGETMQPFGFQKVWETIHFSLIFIGGSVIICITCCENYEGKKYINDVHLIVNSQFFSSNLVWYSFSDIEIQLSQPRISVPDTAFRASSTSSS